MAATARRQPADPTPEGIVGKRHDSLHVPGHSGASVEIRCVGRQEFLVAGWTDPRRCRVGLRALLVR